MRLNFHRVAKWLISAIIIISIPAGYFIYKSDWRHKEQSVLTAPPSEVKGKIITLRQLKEEYFLDYHNMFSSTVRKAMDFPETITLNYTIRYLKIEMERNKDGKQFQYCIFDNKDNRLIGSIEIREKDPDDPGQFGFWVNENYWGGGRVQEATALLIDLYFKLHPGRDSFTAFVRPWNKRSYYALKKAGFKDVGFSYKDDKIDYKTLIYNKK